MKVYESIKFGKTKNLINNIRRKRVKNNQNLGKMPYNNFGERTLIYIIDNDIWV